ncbi:MAG: KEOPS complex subunit Pcc1 [Natronomonas sp.]
MNRRVRIRTEHDDPHTVASAIRPDNTDEMETHIEDGLIVTMIERDTIGGLRTTADDYVTNLQVAARLAAGEAGTDENTPLGDSTDSEYDNTDSESRNTDNDNTNIDTEFQQ